MSEIANVDVAQARELVRQGALILDVREDSEFEAGHAPGACHVALAKLPDQVADFPHDRKIVCVCRSGGRSARATRFLAENGFEALNLEGGMTAWVENEGPLEADQGVATII